ncbi:MAG: ABC transporter ATP-binding protein [Magnetococcales bacterium]|nr:ABC transporter ATP-binding protein [Magnetococcales bacterium]MBF0156555.1 ABC transporter ATP-binding protein [Magnetococcales bacterium]
MVVVQGVTHRYPGRRKVPPRTAVASLDLHVPEGGFVVLTGPNGGGKSTLFRILSGLQRPSEGRVRVAGVDLFQEPAQARRAMGVVFQKPALDPHLTVRENWIVHGELYGMGRRLIRERLDESLSWSDLGGRLDDRVGTLSGGLARQAELVKAMLHHPRLLLMDEPTTGLDPGSREAFLTTLVSLRRDRGVTLFMTSHLFSEAEAASAVAILHQGRLLALETPDRLRSALGETMLVIHTDDRPGLAASLREEGAGVTVTERGGAFLVSGVPEPAVLMEKLWARHGKSIRDLAIKRPSLEDCFIHLTRSSTFEESDPENPS